MRINKYLAYRGFATRKGADILVEQGKVFVNGKKAVHGQKVEAADGVELRGMQKRKYRYFAYNKPAGVITHSPQFGEKDAARASGIAGVFPVGRLDKRSHGLLILTDDARVTDRLLNPDYVHEKTYYVKTNEEVPKHFKERMEGGVDIEGYMTKPAKVDMHGPKTFLITLTEGKKHQIRRMCAALNVTIASLERVRVMNIQLGKLQPGESREIVGKEREDFLKALGLS